MQPYILKTKYAFHSLLWLLKPQVVFDVGSMDGADSKRFRTLAHDAAIVAFEANPENYRKMAEDVELSGRNIRVFNQIVSGQDGVRSFFVQQPDSEAEQWNRGTSSLIARSENGMECKQVELASTRLDSFLRTFYPAADNCAAWIDVEGAAYEVIESMGDMGGRFSLLHVEVETQSSWPNQKLEADVLELTRKMGFVLAAHGDTAASRPRFPQV